MQLNPPIYIPKATLKDSDSQNNKFKQQKYLNKTIRPDKINYSKCLKIYRFR